MIELYGILQEQESINAELGLGVDYYKGEPGEQGIPGKDGKTPVKGVDYFTDAEITEIKDEIAEKVQVGAKGEDGKSAYQLAVEAGYEGSEADWLASLKGTDGRNGIDGINGTNGKDGKTPVKGVDYFTTAEINEIEEGAAAKVDLSNYAKTADLSTVATSGSYNDLSDKPSIPEPYELPVASTTALGGVKVGSGLSITNGVLSATGGGTADSVDWSKIQNKPNFANVATSGDYNDLSNKPTIPSVEGLASEAYVNEKVAAIVIPEVPTKVSELENDKGYLTEHQSLEGYAKTADLAQVAKTGSYNDLIDKPTIPSTTGLATETYVDDKIAEIDIPTVPTKVSAFANDAGYLTEHQSLIEYAKKTDIPAPYTLPTASTSTLGGVKVDGNTITIADGVISSVGGSGGSEPNAYIKDASVNGNTLTLTKKDDTEVVFTPSGGSGGGVSGYAFMSSQTFTDEDKLHLKEVYSNKNIHMTINYLTVVRIVRLGLEWGFIVINTNGATSNQVLVYSITLDSNGNITSDTFTLYMSYYLAGNSSALSGDIITSENWSQYISSGGGDWQTTTYTADSNLYNAKEMVLYWQDSSSMKHQSYLNFIGDFNFGVGQTLGTGWINVEICLDADDTISHPFITYNGTNIKATNCVIFFILYKT